MPDAKDLNDGKEWSDMDLQDLRGAIEAGDTIEEAARFLCRSTNVAEVAAKARELGLRVQYGSEPRRIDVVYADGHWLAQLGPDEESHFDCDYLRQLISAVQRTLPDQALLFVVDYLTIEYRLDAESQFIEAAEKSGAMVISSVQEF
jgi:hypothetical protein